MPEPLQVTFAGSGDAVASGGRSQTCIHVASPGATFLIDCGPASVAALKRLDLGIDPIQALLLTHAHGDHFGGVPYLLLHFIEKQRQAPLYILAPAHLESILEQLNQLVFQHILSALAFNLVFIPMYCEPRPIPGTGISVHPFAMKHQKDYLCLGYQIRFPDGRSLAYTGDTAWNDNLTPLAAGTDLFICECSFLTPPDPAINHLSYAEISRQRELLPTKRLVLTHMGPEMLAARGGLDIETSEDGLTLIL